MNDIIKVKLTPRGVDIFYHRFDGLNERIQKRGGKPVEPHMPRIDKDGFTEMQLWYFMEIYGEHIGVGKKGVIEPINIYIDEQYLEDA